MLVLTRERSESVVIAEEIEVKVVEIRGNNVRLGFIARPDVAVHRKEVVERIAAQLAAKEEVKAA